jgi:hypothetical protein
MIMGVTWKYPYKIKGIIKMIQTQKNNGSFHTVMDYYGVSAWDEAIYIPAGLEVEGFGSYRFYSYGDYPANRDVHTRHLVFSTPEAPDIRTLINSGKALIQYFELNETSHEIEQSIGELVVSTVPLNSSRQRNGILA